jgi:hypothetical protein
MGETQLVVGCGAAAVLHRADVVPSRALGRGERCTLVLVHDSIEVVACHHGSWHALGQTACERRLAGRTVAIGRHHGDGVTPLREQGDDFV